MFTGNQSSSSYLFLGAFLLLTVGKVVSTEETGEPEYRRRYHYQQSIKAPVLVDQKVPGFDLNQGAKATDKSIRLSSSIPGSQGSVWSQEPNFFPEWEVEYTFTVSGRGAVGKDGLAFWYSQERSEPGPVLGNRDGWTGLAIFQDTYDKISNAVSPYILGIMNDGTKEVANDTNILSHMFGGCYRNFRNLNHPTYVKVSYIGTTLKVAVDSEHSGKVYLPCFESHEIQLPTGYYFGFSASSSDPADDHDLNTLAVYEVNPPAGEHDMTREYERDHMKDGKLAVSQEEQSKYDAAQSMFSSWFDGLTSTSSEQPPQIETVQSISDRITKKFDDLNKKLDAKISDPTAPPAGDHHEDLTSEVTALTHKLELLTQALTKTQAQITLVQSLVESIHQTEATDLNSLTREVDTLSDKLEELMHHGTQERLGVESHLDTVTTSLWHLFLIAIVGGTFLTLFLIYRARQQSAGKKYL